jgi:hypothetical protein
LTDRVTGWQRRALASYDTRTLMEELLLRRMDELPPSQEDLERELVVKVLAHGCLHDVLFHFETHSDIAITDALQALLAYAQKYRAAEDLYAHALSMHSGGDLDEL